MNESRVVDLMLWWLDGSPSLQQEAAKGGRLKYQGEVVSTRDDDNDTNTIEKLKFNQAPLIIY